MFSSTETIYLIEKLKKSEQKQGQTNGSIFEYFKNLGRKVRVHQQKLRAF